MRGLNILQHRYTRNKCITKCQTTSNGILKTNYMEKPIITSDDLVEFDLDAYPIWTCTNRLRWDRSEVKITRQGFGI